MVHGPLKHAPDNPQPQFANVIEAELPIAEYPVDGI